jgi:Flp pilus assembly protein TadG
MRTLLKNKRGNVAITFALALIPMCVLIGGAVDFSRAMSAKRQLRDTLDGAALAVGAVPNFTQAQATQIATDFANANYPSQSLGAPAKIDSITITDTELTINGSASVPTTILGLAAIKKIDVKTDVKVQRAGWNVEASLALDLSNSMNTGSKMADLRVAANDFVDTVVQDSQFPYTSKVAIAPYGNAVNVGTLATQVRGPLATPATCTTFGCPNYQFTAASSGGCDGNLNTGSNKNTVCKYAVNNCVTERTDSYAYTDAAPSTSYFGKNYASTSSSGNKCLATTIVPLTATKSVLHTAINSLTAAGSTGGHLGVGWGWYLVSPNFGYLFPGSSQPNPYNDKKTMKVMVLMTDGEYNSPYCNGVISKDAISGSGSATDHNSCNAPNGDTYAQAGKLCDNMKKAGVIVYTIGFNFAAGPAETLLKNCASSPSAPYFNTPKSGSELKAVFKNIAKSISQLKIAH